MAPVRIAISTERVPAPAGTMAVLNCLYDCGEAVIGTGAFFGVLK